MLDSDFDAIERAGWELFQEVIESIQNDRQFDAPALIFEDERAEPVAKVCCRRIQHRFAKQRGLFLTEPGRGILRERVLVETALRIRPMVEQCLPVRRPKNWSRIAPNHGRWS